MIGALVIKFIAAGLCLCASVCATGQIVRNDGAKARWVKLDKVGEARVQSRAGRHHADVTITVTRLDKHLPLSMVIGPSPVENDLAGANPTRVISKIDIRIDGCAVNQPVPALAGFTDANNANLQFIGGRWQLEITGSDGAESYGVIYAFDSRRVIARSLTWGPSYTEETRYDISVDHDMVPQDCSLPAR